MVWLSIKDTLPLLEISRQAFNKALLSGKYTSQRVNSPNGGRPVWEIALDSLPQEAQDRYWAQVRAQQEALNPGK
ncbi:MAG: hypothetical protein Q4F00_09840, partial [bacterium]|nr:hypothetical protein [bacterium]